MKGRKLVLLAIKILVLAVALVVLSAIGSAFLPASGGAAPGGDEAAAPAPPSGSLMTLVYSVMLLQTIALAFPVVRARWHGWGLALAVFVLYFGTVTFQSQIESLVYLGHRMPEGMLAGLFAMGLFTAALFSPLLVLVLGRWRSPAAADAAAREPRPESASPGGWWWKAAVGGLVFVALYYLFGYFVAWQSPAVRDYYGGTDPGSFVAQMGSIVDATLWMLPFQFARGLVWVALAFLAMRMMRGPWWQAGLAVSLLFTVPSVYLLLPNPMMPEAVRMAHLVETVPYQFGFGWFVVWLFRRYAPPRLMQGDGARAASVGHP